MSRVVVINHLTLDGVMQAPGRPDEDTRDGFAHGGWSAPNVDDQLLAATYARVAESGGMRLLLGRRSYEDMLGYWNTQDSPFKDGLNNAPKYVASRTRRVRKLVRALSRAFGSLGSALLPWSREAVLLWSFVYLVVRNLFALVWLLARPRRSKELEILVLRHELAILRRQASRPKLTQADRALLTSLSRSLPRPAWTGFTFKPETLLRWHRQLIARRWTYAHRRPGRPPLERSLRELILLLARENSHWGYKRIVGELKGLGISVSPTSVRKVLLEAGLQPAPQRTHSSWRAFLRAQAASMLACDFLTVETIFLQRIYVLFFISLATRRIEYLACSSNPDGRWVTQQARNLAMQLGDEQPFRFLIHDRDTKFSHAFDEVFRTEGIKVIRTPVQAPNANAFAERWVRIVRSDCLDRILILGRRHLEQVLRIYRHHYNEHRPHRALQLLPPNGRNPTPLNTSPDCLRRRDLLGGLIHEYEAA